MLALALAFGLSTAAAQSTAEHIVEIRVHGNTRVADQDVLSAAGLIVGGPASEGSLDEAKRRLEKSGKFDSVEVLKRFRSLDDASAAAIILVVHERPEGEGSAWTRPLRRLASGRMFLPIVRFADGYGVTYGARVSAVNTLGFGERWSVPLTWGGTRGAALELERTFTQGPIDTLQSRFGIAREINPHFALSDRRVGWDVKAGRSLGVLRLAAEGGGSRVRFGSLSEQLWTSGATVTLDTRGNPAFPANALYLTGGWRGLWRGGQSAAGIALGDARGYWRPVNRMVLAARLRYEGSNRPLPDYERLLIGGASSLRGEPAGMLAGDRSLATSAEARMLFRSPLRLAQLAGATVFVDAAKVYDAAQSASAAPWSSSAGVGLFANVPFIKINVHVAKPLDGGAVRAHLSFGFTF